MGVATRKHDNQGGREGEGGWSEEVAVYSSNCFSKHTLSYPNLSYFHLTLRTLPSCPNLPSPPSRLTPIALPEASEARTASIRSGPGTRSTVQTRSEAAEVPSQGASVADVCSGAVALVVIG